jgi:predicted  nucleic acid-binding Zn-ribbon protein
MKRDFDFNPYVKELLMTSLHMTRSSSGIASQSASLDVMRDSARSILASKDAEIARLNREIDETERMIDETFDHDTDSESSLKADISKIEQELASLTSSRHTRSADDSDGVELQPHRSTPEAADTDIAAARARTSRLNKEVLRLEAELRQITTQQQQQIAEHAKAIQKSTKADDEFAFPKFSEEICEAQARLKRVRQTNAQLDRSIAEIATENTRKQAQISALKQQIRQSPKPILTELTVVDAEIIRLADENEDLKAVLQNLDRIAYDPHFQ